MYFLFTVRWAYKRGRLLATVYGTLFIFFFISSVPVAYVANFRQAPVVYIFYAIVKCACTKLPLLQ